MEVKVEEETEEEGEDRRKGGRRRRDKKRGGRRESQLHKGENPAHLVISGRVQDDDTRKSSFLPSWEEGHKNRAWSRGETILIE